MSLPRGEVCFYRSRLYRPLRSNAAALASVKNCRPRLADLVNSCLSVRKKKHGESFSRLTRGFSIRRMWKVHVGLVTFHDLPLLRSEDVDGDFSRTPFEDVDGDFDL